MTNSIAASAPGLPRAVAKMALLQALVALAIFSVAVTAPVTGVTLRQVGMFQSLMFAVGAVLSLLSGKLCAQFGPIRVAQGCAIAVAAGALLLAHASGVGLSPAWLVAAAILFGLGFGPETPASSAFLGPLTPPAKRPLVFSIRQTGNQIGAMFGSLVLPGLAVVAADAAFGLVAALGLAVVLLLETMRRHEPAAAADSVQARLLDGWRQVWGHRGLSLLIVPLVAFSAMQACLNGFLALHAVQAWQMQPVQAGLLVAAAQGGGLIGRLSWGALASRYASARRWLAWIGIGMSGCALLVSLAGPHVGASLLLALAFVFGLTASGWNGVFLAEVARLSPGAEAAATGALLTLSYAGLVLGPLVFPLLVSPLAPGGGFLALALIAAIGTFVLFVSRNAAD